MRARCSISTGNFIRDESVGGNAFLVCRLFIVFFRTSNYAWIEKCVCKQWVSCVGTISI